VDRAPGTLISLENDFLADRQGVVTLVVGIVHDLLYEDPHRAVTGIGGIDGRSGATPDGRGIAVLVVLNGHVGDGMLAEERTACGNGHGGENLANFHCRFPSARSEREPPLEESTPSRSRR
jgi:hypothetical protein